MRKTKVIHLKLGRVEDMFQAPDWNPMSSHDAYEAGIDYCVSELRSRRSRSPIRLELDLPASKRDPSTAARIRQAVSRYCEDRIHRNDRERRIVRRDAYAALKVGVPVALVGLAIAVATAVAQTEDTLPNLAGWVLAWVGLWYPLDAILFASVSPKRENGILVRLQEAEVVVNPP